MILRAASTTRCGRRAAVPIVLAAALSVCGGTAPISYEAKTAIPLGHVNLEIGRFEPGGFQSPIVANAPPEDRVYAVYLSVSGLDSIDDGLERHAYISNFLVRQLTLVDVDGDRFMPASAQAQWAYEFRDGSVPQPPSEERYWVVTFQVPEVSRDFTLLLRNPDPQKDQPAAASVHLGTPEHH